nr:MAG TPA: hypothetical protein [Caudoviricetes sp.]
MPISLFVINCSSYSLFLNCFCQSLFVCLYV